MPVLVGSLGDLGLNYLAFVGKVSRTDALEFPASIVAESPEFGVRWLTIFDVAADMSDLDADCLLALKARLAPVIVRLAVKGPFRIILISHSMYNDHLVACWQAMTASDPDYPSNPETAPSIADACARHVLTLPQAAAAEAWMKQRLWSETAH